ncbi:uncharacterized protein LOC121858663 isoform X2 [Homarus americanus]|uniref:uncharacterized protein LOC121858663 isoform X2 n=1 Tax=Homarus americanus TaxID=6706 RepID=UPI001C43C1AF|nr:uncharacterized protein LOC121858663 isoform X2 [Homarus americanus]
MENEENKKAAELEELKRKLRRKEHKLKKYKQAKEAKKHVRDTLRRHNAAGDTHDDLCSDSIKTDAAERDLMSSMSRMVTFSEKSPEVINVSPTPQFEGKIIDKTHKSNRSLSIQSEVLMKETDPGPSSSGISIEKLTDTAETDTDVQHGKPSPKISKTGNDSSEIRSLSEMVSHKDNNSIYFPEQNSLVSDKRKIVVGESNNNNEIVDLILSEKQCYATFDTSTNFPQTDDETLPSNPCCGHEVTSCEVYVQTQDSLYMPSSTVVNWIENVSGTLKPGDTNATSNSLPANEHKMKASGTCSNSLVHKSLDSNTKHVQQEYKVQKSIEIWSQDLFDSEALPLTRNIEIKRSCISYRERWKKRRTSQNSNSGGSGSGSGNQTELKDRRLNDTVRENTVSPVSCEPLKHPEMHAGPGNKEHLTEEILIEEIEQEMMKEFYCEIFEQEKRSDCEITEADMMEVSDEGGGKTFHEKNDLTTLNTVDEMESECKKDKLKKDRDKDVKQENGRLAKVHSWEGEQIQSKFLENSVNGLCAKDIYKKNLDKDSVLVSFCEPDVKIEQQPKASHVPRDCNIIDDEKDTLLDFVQDTPEKLSDATQMEKRRKNDFTMDLGFEKIVRGNEIEECLSNTESNKQAVNSNEKEDAISSAETLLMKPVKFTGEGNTRFHNLSANEKHGKVLTSSLITLRGGSEQCILIVQEFGFSLWNRVRQDRVKLNHHIVDKGSINGKQSSKGEGLREEKWETVDDASHHIGRASDVRDIVAVGLPSDEEARYLVAVTKLTEKDVWILYVQFSHKEKWQVIENRLDLSLCNTYKNLGICALSEWSVAIAWSSMEPSTAGCFVVMDIDVTYSRRSKQWELKCHSSTRSPFWEEPVDSLIALHQPDPKGVVLCSSRNSLYVYDAMEDIIIEKVHLQAAGLSWAVAVEDLVFLIGMDIITSQLYVLVLNPINGLFETFSKSLPNNLRMADNISWESTSNFSRNGRVTGVCLESQELIIVFDAGTVIHMSFDAFREENVFARR